MSDEIPPAVVVQSGKVPGDVPGAPAATASPHKRHVSNYLVDRRLQLRYALIITAVSLAIAATLGALIYQQEHRASADLLAGLRELADDSTLHGFDAETLREYQRATAADIEARDRRLVLEMLAIGLGLTLILSGYLVVMTHKVAGPLYKIATYLDQMAEGRWHEITPLRRGDMLQDFYAVFREMHQAVRARLKGDAETMQRFARIAAAESPSGPAARELEQLEQLAGQRLSSLG